MDKERHPYIGVTDITTRQEVIGFKVAIPLSCPRVLHVGLMTSYKFIHGLPTKWADIWLHPIQQKTVFVDVPRVYNVIHYADYDTPAPTTHAELVLAVIGAGNHVHAIQLDMLWPSVDLIKRFKEYCPTIEIILQVSSKAMAAVDSWEKSLTAYKGLVDYVLIDAGMGQGIDFDIPTTLQHLDTVVTMFDTDHKVAVAGGLGPDTFQKLAPLFEIYPNLSCDAQSKLRPSHNAINPLDYEMTRKYITGVCSLIN